VKELSTRQEAVRFLAVGGLAAAANFGSRIGFSQFAAYEIAITLAFFVGLTTAFILNREWVFVRANRSALAEQMTKFLLVNLLGLGVTLGVSVLLARRILPALGVRAGLEEIGHFAGIGATVLISYLAHKHWTFRP